ncbi:hypothetical protein SO802_032168 [Lithocarpus litseifolius]|uniref:Uncharacterized protein n=1 Tax=Lithocarpus litseifolius TaxID=425828 RepID=A0AAW2BPT6_9ROSI
MAMLYNAEVGWTAESLDPKSAHWKRKVRENRVDTAQDNLSPIEPESLNPGNNKRESPTPLKELNPKSLEVKRRKGGQSQKAQEKESSDTDGGVAADFIDVFWKLREDAKDLDWSTFATTAWCIWNNRNLYKHKGRCKPTKVLASDAIRYTEEYRHGNSQTIQTPRQPPRLGTQWRPPEHGQELVLVVLLYTGSDLGIYFGVGHQVGAYLVEELSHF